MTSRPTLVLVPGLSGRPELDFPFLAPMLRRWFDVTEVTFAGLAEAGLAEPTLNALAERVTEAVDSCATPPIVVGFSLGALAAAASRAPVAGLVLVAGWWQPSPPLVLFAQAWARLRAEGSGALADVARFALASPEGLATVPALPADALTDALVALAAHADLATAPVLAAPVLVVGARADALATPHESRLLFGAIPDARFAEVRSGHAVPHERPAELLELVTSFAADPRRYPSGTVIPESAP